MKPRWPRFSLRTLIIVVLGIALCWTLTATWGVSSIYISYSQTNDSGGNPFTVVVMANSPSGRKWIERGIAIAPFLIRYRVVLSPNDTAYLTETHFWFFGYHRMIHSNY